MMKRTTILLALFAVSFHSMAQKFLDIYKDNQVVTSVSTADVDSMTVNGTGSDRTVNFWKDDNIVHHAATAAIDSIKVYRPQDDPLVYLGIVGFNQELYEKPIGVLSTSTVGSYKSFITNLSRKDGTMLYYAVDDGLDMLTSYDFETSLNNIYLITFTDGLDQGSLMMNGNYASSNDYLSAVSNRIGNTRIKSLPLTAYSIGLRGSDVTDYPMFQNNLKRLASSNDKAFEVNSLTDVNSRLQEIAATINSSITTKTYTTTQTLSMKIPGIDSGSRICFTFDGKTPTNSTACIEGTFNLQNRSLTNVVYRGISGATTGATVQGTQNGIFVTFTFNFVKVQNTSGAETIPTNNVREYYKTPMSTTWQISSEFTSANNTQTDIKTTVDVKRSGAVVLFVLDCSNSLGSQFDTMKSYVKDFTQRVADNTGSCNLVAPGNVKANLAPVDNVLQINVRWNAVKYASSYDVYRSNSSSGTYEKVAEGVKTSSWTDESPLSGYNYYKVKAVGYGFTSPLSSVSNSVNKALDAPSNVKGKLALSSGNFVINVTWDAVKFTESYTIYRSSDGWSGTFTKVAEGVKTSSWTDESPVSGGNYYSVEAVGYGLTSPRSSTSVNKALDTPTNVKGKLALSSGNFVINVTWDAVKFAESYTIYRSSDGWSNTFSKVAEGVKTSSWTDESPLLGYNYYSVEAVGYGLTSKREETKVFKPLPNDGVITVKGVSFKMIHVSKGIMKIDEDWRSFDDYFIGETEVTQELWQAVMGSNPSYFKGNKLPVEQVSWNDCQTFITKLNALTGMTFKLPHEDDWEYAARGGTQSKGYTYSGSNTLGDVAWYVDNSSSKTHEVATKAPNELGIYDMSGNVREWCINGRKNISRHYMMRGGCYGNGHYGCEVFYNNYDHMHPEDTDRWTGFRLAMFGNYYWSSY